MSEEIARAVEATRERIRRNLPRHRDPERFHEELSEITLRLTLIARWQRTGRRPDGLEP